MNDLPESPGADTTHAWVAQYPTPSGGPLQRQNRDAAVPNITARAIPLPVAKRASVAARWLAVYAVVSVGRLTDLLPFAHSLPLAKITFAGVLIAAFRGRSGVSPVPLKVIGLARAVAAFAVLVVASVIFSVWLSQSARFIAGTFLTVVVTFFVSVKVLAHWCDIRAVLKGVALVGLLLAGVALAGYSGGRAYVQSMYDTNDLAYVLMGILPISMSFGVISTRLPRFFWYAVSTIIVAAGLLTQSRGGLLALAAIVLALVWRPLRVPTPDSRRRFGVQGLWVRATLAALLSVTAWTQLPHDAQERLGLLFNLKEDYNTDLNATSSRSSIWKRNVIAGLERPIGFGVNTFEYVDGRTGGNYKAPHNSAIEIFVELGALGLILWARLWFLAWSKLRPPPPPASTATQDAQREWREQAVMSQALRISLAALFVGGFFLSQAYSLIFWQLLGVCAAASVLFGTNTKRVPRSRPVGALR